MATKTTKPAKPLISDFEKLQIIQTLSNPKLSAGRLAWAHYLIGRAMKKHKIEPHLKRSRARS